MMIYVYFCIIIGTYNCVFEIVQYRIPSTYKATQEIIDKHGEDCQGGYLRLDALIVSIEKIICIKKNC